MWNVATGVCEGVLQGHTDTVRALAVAAGDRLLSASCDHSIKVRTVFRLNLNLNLKLNLNVKLSQHASGC